MTDLVLELRGWEIGYYSPSMNGWITSELIKKRTEDKYPGTLDRRRAYCESWERDPRTTPFSGPTHPIGSTRVRPLYAQKMDAESGG